jgi:hypothetical protein
LLAERFTKADVDYLIAEAKFIKAVPVLPRLDPRLTTRMIRVLVFRKSQPNNAIKGLVAMAKVHIPPPGLPRLNPSSALEWYGKRIRGLNKEIWHDNPDGTTVRGWHEHLWSPEEQDSYVVPARPKLIQTGLLDVFKWGLKKWNIEVVEKQLEEPSWRK